MATRTMIGALGLLVSLPVACADSLPVPGGTPCEYIHFSGRCELIDVVVPDGADEQIQVLYRPLPPTELDRDTAVSLVFTTGPGERQAVLARFVQLARPACRISVITQGTCNPESVGVEVPDCPECREREATLIRHERLDWEDLPLEEKRKLLSR